MKINLEDIKEKVREVIEPVINSLGIDLDFIELNQMKRKVLLRVFIDTADGITIDDCEKVSREVEAVLDVEDPIPQSYVLEVSSPGLDRPLHGVQDFKRFSGKNIRIVTQEPIERQTFFVGKIAEAGDDRVVLVLPRNKEVIIPYSSISRARLEAEV